MPLLTRKQFVRTAILPGIRPRIQDVFLSGFQFIPYFMALVYHTVGLLPAGHPYLNNANAGKFGVRHVMAAAANNLTFRVRYCDQIALFILLLVGVIICFVQIALLLFGLAVGVATAGTVGMPTNFRDFFLLNGPNPTHEHDLAYMMFDLIFGIPGLFNSCIDSTVGALVECQDTRGNEIFNAGAGSPLGSNFVTTLTWPFPVHTALHQLFQFYSIGLLVIAAMITAYFIAVVVMETAQSGVPFGKRFNKVWAPLRIVVAIGLLIPINSGLNSSQYIVLYAAKFGSGFATNGWKLFNANLTGTILGNQTNLVPMQFSSVEMNTLLQFLYTASTCYEVYKQEKDQIVELFVVRDNHSSSNVAFVDDRWNPVGPPAPGMLSIYDYNDLYNFSQGDKTVNFVFGIYDPQLYPSYRGHVGPICGELALDLVDPRNPSLGYSAGGPEPAAVTMQAYYLGIITELWYYTFYGDLPPSGARAAEMQMQTITFFAPGFGVITIPIKGFIDPGINYSYNTMRVFTTTNPDPLAVMPSAWYRTGLIDFYARDLRNAMSAPDLSATITRPDLLDDPLIGNVGVLPQLQNSSTAWSHDRELNNDLAFRNKGWAAAGIWYNKLASLNGTAFTLGRNAPYPILWAQEMEILKAVKRGINADTHPDKWFKPDLAQDSKAAQMAPASKSMQLATWVSYNFWQEAGHGKTSHTQRTGNAVYDFINHFLGTSGIYSMRTNPDVHPLAQIVALGKSLIEAANHNFVAAISGSGASILAGTGANLANVFTSAFMTLATITFTAGFILFYIVPFMPFIYFFFAVGTWFKAIFEAMVGAPLWALAHIRIDGDGLPGRAAVNGYYMIFEIFLRPILIVFGLLASISIFSAMVSVLNQAWDLVSANLGGFDVESEAATKFTGPNSKTEFMRGPLDEFFFTVIYAIVVYMMGMASFKLIDTIPSNMLRWMGQSVQTFNDGKDDAGQSLMGTATLGAQQTTSALGGSAKNLLQVAVGKPG